MLVYYIENASTQIYADPLHHSCTSHSTQWRKHQLIQHDAESELEQAAKGEGERCVYQHTRKYLSCYQGKLDPDMHMLPQQSSVTYSIYIGPTHVAACKPAMC